MEPKKRSFSKIIVPNITGVFLRKRLMRLMDNGRKKPLIRVHGPAGAGKTTMVAGYLKCRHQTVPTRVYRIFNNTEYC
ncbi:MAG: hypothetical protein ACUZ8O_07260 [Candidatus Anammoxibacter sp.]